VCFRTGRLAGACGVQARSTTATAGSSGTTILGMEEGSASAHSASNARPSRPQPEHSAAPQRRRHLASNCSQISRSGRREMALFIPVALHGKEGVAGSSPALGSIRKPRSGGVFFWLRHIADLFAGRIT
jgi:hypothetical protein